jgi:hypothetical protein
MIEWLQGRPGEDGTKPGRDSQEDRPKEKLTSMVSG